MKRELKGHHEEQLNRARPSLPPLILPPPWLKGELRRTAGRLDTERLSADNSRRFCPFSSTFLLSSSSSSFLSAIHRRTETLVPSTPSPPANEGTTRTGASPEERRTVRSLRCGPATSDRGAGRSSQRRSHQSPYGIAPLVDLLLPSGSRLSPRGTVLLSLVGAGWTRRCHARKRRSLRRRATPLLRSPSMGVVEVRSKHVHATVANGVRPS